MSIAEKLTIIAENEQKVFDAGKQAEYDRFWDSFQERGNRRYYPYAFYSWSNAYYKPKYPFSGIKNCNAMFQATLITDTLQPIDLSALTSMHYDTFSNASSLKTIRKIITSEESGYTNFMKNCSALENVTWEGSIGKTLNMQWSTLLNAESIRSIINCLSSTATGQTLTLSQIAVNNAFTTEEWNELIADKTNWTISLV